MRFKLLAGAVLGLSLLLSGCDPLRPPAQSTEEPSPSPVETGYQPTGRANPNVKPNGYEDGRFISLGGFTIYTGGGAASHIGVDVSAHQREIDWVQVRQAGVEFAMIRTGFRGYVGGKVSQDDCFTQNIEGALAAGLQVGVYFFSQATTVEEAREEAQATLNWIAPYNVTYPVVFDWENIPNAQARTDSVEPEKVTQCAIAFCETVKEAGYLPMVYSNRHQVYEILDLEQLSEYQFWLASYAATPGYDYHFDMWQYGSAGTVPGVEGEVDLNIGFVDYPVQRQTDAHTQQN